MDNRSFRSGRWPGPGILTGRNAWRTPGAGKILSSAPGSVAIAAHHSCRGRIMLPAGTVGWKLPKAPPAPSPHGCLRYAIWVPPLRLCHVIRRRYSLRCDRDREAGNQFGNRQKVAACQRGTGQRARIDQGAFHPGRPAADSLRARPGTARRAGGRAARIAPPGQPRVRGTGTDPSETTVITIGGDVRFRCG